MSTAIRPEISENNKYWISKHRYYELRHFCLQYKEWKQAYAILLNGCMPSANLLHDIAPNYISDKTATRAILLGEISDKINLVDVAAKEADPEIGDYILKAVTEDRPYHYLRTALGMPCGKDMFYDRYRKFFWLLDKKR